MKKRFDARLAKLRRDAPPYGVIKIIVTHAGDGEDEKNAVLAKPPIVHDTPQGKIEVYGL